MVEELWIFKEIADMVASDWCHLSLGTPSINPSHSGCKVGCTKPKPYKLGPLSASQTEFRWFSEMGGLRTKEMSFMHRDVSALVHHGPSLIKPEHDLKAQRFSAFDPFALRALGALWAIPLPIYAAYDTPSSPMFNKRKASGLSRWQVGPRILTSSSPFSRRPSSILSSEFAEIKRELKESLWGIERATFLLFSG